MSLLVKITDTDTGEVLFESTNGHGVMCVVAEEDGARGHARYSDCPTIGVLAMVSIWQDIMKDCTEEYPIIETLAPIIAGFGEDAEE